MLPGQGALLGSGFAVLNVLNTAGVTQIAQGLGHGRDKRAFAPSLISPACPWTLPCMRKDELEAVPPQPQLVAVILSFFSFVCCLGERHWNRLQREMAMASRLPVQGMFNQCLGTGWDSWSVLSSQELDSMILVGPFELQIP